MAEQVNLTTPIPGQAAIAVLRPSFLSFDMNTGRIVIQLREWNGTAFVRDGRFREYSYDATTAPTGASLIVALNTANLSANSLERRIMTQLIASGLLAGNIAGTPD